MTTNVTAFEVVATANITEWHIAKLGGEALFEALGRNDSLTALDLGVLGVHPKPYTSIVIECSALSSERGVRGVLCASAGAICTAVGV